MVSAIRFKRNVVERIVIPPAPCPEPGELSRIERRFNVNEVYATFLTLPRDVKRHHNAHRGKRSIRAFPAIVRVQ